MDFVTGLPLSANWKSNNYDLILIIIDRFTKMMHYKPVNIIINTPGPAKVIINIVVRYYDLSDSIISDRGAIFMSKFWFLLCYFLGIKKQLSTTFDPQTDR